MKITTYFYCCLFGASIYGMFWGPNPKISAITGVMSIIPLTIAALRWEKKSDA